MSAPMPQDWVSDGTAIDLDGLARIQDLTRELLGELDRACRAAGVPYLLAYGTALGAHREGDLIGWDIDADVWVRREHHDDLAARVAPLLGADYELLTPETHDDYEYLFPRLVRRGIHHVYVRVDVFPLDPAPRSAAGRTAYLRTARLLARWFYAKRADPALRNHYRRRFLVVLAVLRALTRIVPDRAVLRAFRRLQGLHAGRGTGVLVNSCGSYGDREFLDATWFDATTTVRLAGAELPAPGGLEQVLEHFYGDWRTPPAAERQRFELEIATARLVVPMREAGLLP